MRSPTILLLTPVLVLTVFDRMRPDNIWAAANSVPYGGNVIGPGYLLIRVPYQVFLLWWVHWSTEQDWLPVDLFPCKKKAD